MVVCHKEEGSYVRFLDLKERTPKLRPLDFTGFHKEAEEVASLTRLDKIIFAIYS